MGQLRKVFCSDIFVITALSVAIFTLAIEYNFFEHFYHFASINQELKLGELATILVVLSFAFVLFGARRWFEARHAYSQLGQALAEKEEALETARKIARRDALTDLLNRKGCQEAVVSSLARASRSNSKIAIMLIDVDRFKDINDEYGHKEGDFLLQQIGERFSKLIRKTDYIARIGGDEFAIILNDLSDYSGAGKVARKVLDSLETPFSLNSNPSLIVSCSIGISVAPQDSNEVSQLLHDADLAMYQAKASGRRGYQFYTSVLQAEVIRKLTLERELRAAVKNGELEPWFQPQYELDSLDLIGFEALVRWRHPVQGLLPPGEFISMAEESKLIIGIGEVVLDKSCAHLKKMQKLASKPLKMSINLSPVQLENPDLITAIRKSIRRHKVNPRNLILEITENILLSNTKEVLDRLAEIKALGIQVALDDFGTGYSAIAYLQQFQFDQIKIDRSFIKGAHEDGKDIRLVKLMLGIASHMGMDTVAEGIENPAQLDALRGLDCPLGQGYLFSKPVDAQEAEELVLRDEARKQGNAKSEGYIEPEYVGTVVSNRKPDNQVATTL